MLYYTRVMKKILITVSYYYPHISGLTNSTKNLAELLAENGYDVTILTTQHTKDLSKSETINKVNIVRVPYFYKFHKGFFLPKYPYIAFKMLLRNDQLIINLPQPEGFLSAFFAKMLNKKIHCIYHCEVNIKGGFGAKLIEYLLYLSNKISISLANTIIVSSKDFADNSALLAKYKNKVKDINLVIPPPAFSQKEKTELLKELSTRKKYLIGFIGRIAAEKGVEYLLNSIPIIKQQLGNDFAIVLAGPKKVVGEQKYLDKITELIKKYEDNIIEIGELEQKELGAFYNLLDVLVLPSINSTEAFGIVQIEAMFCGTPVVATNIPGVRVPVEISGMGEIAEKENSKDLAEKIIKVLGNKSKYIKNKEKVEKEFSADKILSKYKEILG